MRDRADRQSIRQKRCSRPHSFCLYADCTNCQSYCDFFDIHCFGNSAKFAVLRVLGSLLVAMVVGIWLAYFSKQEILKKQLSTASTEHHQGHHHDHDHVHTHESEAKKRKWTHQMRHLLQHSIDEFFDTGRYLIIGGLIAAAMQTYLPTGMMLTLGSTKFLAVLVMLVLALTMSLCSEADAFIGSSLLSLFGAGPVVGFLVFGPMVDIKNLLMMKRYFTGRFIATMVGLIAVVVSIYAWVV
jgi:uncharacterized membrane protein YraQ (UPF0718 family)